MSQSAHSHPAGAHAESAREAVPTQHLPCRTQDPEGCGRHQHSVADPEARDHSAQITEPLRRQVEPAKLQAGNLPAHSGTSAQIQADPSVLIIAAGQDAKDSARPSTGSNAGATAPSIALTQHKTLRFDPMIGECGAFVIVGDEGPPATSQVNPVMETSADVSHAQERVLADSLDEHEEASNAGIVEQSSHSATAELAEMPRQALPKPQPQKDSRAEVGSSACPVVDGSAAAEEPSQRGCSPRMTDGAKRSSVGRSSKHFEGNLLDLVAEVEELISQGPCSTWDVYDSGSVECNCAHSKANSPVARAMQDENCQNWIGSLLRA